MDKKSLRKELISLRDSFEAEYKSECDNAIADLLFSTDEYVNANEILIYISVRSEVDTSRIISGAFSDGKQVAVPNCKNGVMNFYYIKSVDDLTCSQFGVPTVDINKAVCAAANEKSLCIVPALSFDKNGNRLGYGGGYYDRFLTANKVKTIGLCRERSMSDSLPSEKFDIKINTVITEKSVSRRRVNIGK